MVNAVNKAIEELDANQFAKLAGDLLGGECYWISSPASRDLLYEFIPDENYGGAFGNIENTEAENA